MDPAILDYLMLAVGTLTATTFGFGIAWLRARERAIRAEAQAESGQRSSEVIDARFDRIDQFVDTLAVELERIAEAGRFQSKLLASRGNVPASDRPAIEGRVITPH